VYSGAPVEGGHEQSVRLRGVRDAHAHAGARRAAKAHRFSVRVAQRGRQHAAVGHLGQQRPALFERAESGHRQHAQSERRQGRQRQRLPTDLGEHDARLDRPEPVAAEVLGQRQRQQPGLAHGLPGGLVVSELGGEHRDGPAVVGGAAQHAGGQLGHRLLGLVKAEIQHRLLGSR
jgi:hypothetical protein